MLRSITLFLHIASAMGLVGALTIEGSLLSLLRSASTADQLRSVMVGFRSARSLAIASLIVTVLTGGYLTAAVWSVSAEWIIVAIVALAVNVYLGMTENPRAMKRLRIGLDGALGGDATPSIAELGRDSRLLTMFIMRAAITVGIVYLMTVKPELTGSLIAMGVSIVGGVIVRTVVVASLTART